MSAVILRAGTLSWFARHELRLAWREWLAMMTAGQRWRARRIVIGFLIFVAILHLVAYAMVGPYAEIGSHPSQRALVVITASLLLSWSAMMSQAMESVTRIFYARADLDLVLSSPAAATRLFAVRIGALALQVTVMALLLAAPFIDMLALRGGVYWLGAYGVVLALGFTAVAAAVAATVALFRALGPKRTRLVAQIAAAVIGAAFVIGLQVAAILSSGTLSRLTLLQSDVLLRHVPAIDSALWWPARAALGDGAALAVVVGASALLLLAAIGSFAPRFAHHTLSTAGIAHGTARSRRRREGFRQVSPAAALRRKEWVLLLRDPWLLSQSLMQLLYLVPPALLLWRNFAAGDHGLALLVPVLIMAAGQLAGGLAWLTISGEDAPDLIATAPVPAGTVVRAKIAAVMGALAVVFVPFSLALSLASPRDAIIAAIGVVIAGASATAIQLWFRSQAKRSQFRRRQTSSRVATFAEAFSSIGWAGTGAVAASGTPWLALLPGLLALGIVFGARAISPARRERAA